MTRTLWPHHGYFERWRCVKLLNKFFFEVNITNHGEWAEASTWIPCTYLPDLWQSGPCPRSFALNDTTSMLSFCQYRIFEDWSLCLGQSCSDAGNAENCGCNVATLQPLWSGVSGSRSGWRTKVSPSFGRVADRAWRQSPAPTKALTLIYWPI